MNDVKVYIDDAKYELRQELIDVKGEVRLVNARASMLWKHELFASGLIIVLMFILIFAVSMLIRIVLNEKHHNIMTEHEIKSMIDSEISRRISELNGGME